MNNNKERNYTSFSEFLVSTPRNLWSVIIIMGISLTIGVSALLTSEPFDPEWTRYAVVAFMGVVAALGVLRPYLIYKRVKK